MRSREKYIGKVYITNEGYELKVINFEKYDKVISQFNNGITIHGSMKEILNGTIKNPYHPSVQGVGYIGLGKYKPSYKGKGTKAYNTWTGMLERCYSERKLNERPTYKDVTVCEEWHNFQNFAAWFEENYNPETMEGWHLDKDIICKECKIYSPDTCAFISVKINNLLAFDNNNEFFGISYHKNKKRFIAQIAKDGKRISLGGYKTSEEAFQVYKKAKENHIKEVAEKWKDKVDIRIYNVLKNFEL